MERILKDLGLSALIQKFKEERIDEKVALSLSGSELIRLGVATIRDRVQVKGQSFKIYARKATQLQETQVQVLVALGLIQIEQPKQELN